MNSQRRGTGEAAGASVHQLHGPTPRRMRVDIAAHYMGVSESTFLSRVKDGTYPPGRKEIGLVFWLRDDLDGYIDRQFAVVRANDDGPVHDDPFATRFRRAS